jgi:hypothetical protein
MAQRKTKMKIVLVSCCGPKLKGRHLAKDIYQSPLFKKSRVYAEREGDAWAILSAKLGVVMPDDEIEDYNLTLNTMAKEDRRTWTNKVREQLQQWKECQIIILAGVKYCEWITDEWNVENPLKGLGIGRRMQFLQKQNELFA